MILIVAGSRGINNYPLVKKYLEQNVALTLTMGA